MSASQREMQGQSIRGASSSAHCGHRKVSCSEQNVLCGGAMHRSDRPPWREPASAWRETTSQPELNGGGFSKAHVHSGSERMLRAGSPSARQWNESPRQAEMRLRKAIAGLHTPSPPRGLPVQSPRRPHSAHPLTRTVTAGGLQDELGMTRDVLSAAQQQLLNARKSASAARQAEERALTAVLKTRDEARVQVMQACDEAKQQIVSAQAHPRHHRAAPLPSTRPNRTRPRA
eukprot:scaffold77848_cov65-Phaeocystis_antarctica.AAC.4